MCVCVCVCVSGQYTSVTVALPVSIPTLHNIAAVSCKVETGNKVKWHTTALGECMDGMGTRHTPINSVPLSNVRVPKSAIDGSNTPFYLLLWREISITLVLSYKHLWVHG